MQSDVLLTRDSRLFLSKGLSTYHFFQSSATHTSLVFWLTEYGCVRNWTQMLIDTHAFPVVSSNKVMNGNKPLWLTSFVVSWSGRFVDSSILIRQALYLQNSVSLHINRLTSLLIFHSLACVLGTLISPWILTIYWKVDLKYMLLLRTCFRRLLWSQTCGSD